jgi:hypothetical protein
MAKNPAKMFMSPVLPQKNQVWAKEYMKVPAALRPKKQPTPTNPTILKSKNFTYIEQNELVIEHIPMPELSVAQGIEEPMRQSVLTEKVQRTYHRKEEHSNHILSMSTSNKFITSNATNQSSGPNHHPYSPELQQSYDAGPRDLAAGRSLIHTSYAQNRR